MQRKETKLHLVTLGNVDKSVSAVPEEELISVSSCHPTSRIII